MKRFAILALLSVTAVPVAFAHEGHDHSKPAATKAATAAATTGKAASSTKDKAMLQIEQQIAAAKVDKNVAGWRTRLPKPTVATFESGKKYFVTMETTEGKVVIQMMPDVAPMHVTSFLYLAQMGFFDGLSFHRVIPGFMAQGGCPLGTGTGGPGYQFSGEYSDVVKHNKGGLLSMANAGPGTDGSQFFLTFVPTPWLDGKHTIFGEVTEGMETLKALEKFGTSPAGKTTKPLKMDKVTVDVK